MRTDTNLALVPEEHGHVEPVEQHRPDEEFPRRLVEVCERVLLSCRRIYNTREGMRVSVLKGPFTPSERGTETISLEIRLCSVWMLQHIICILWSDFAFAFYFVWCEWSLRSTHIKCLRLRLIHLTPVTTVHHNIDTNNHCEETLRVHLPLWRHWQMHFTWWGPW